MEPNDPKQPPKLVPLLGDVDIAESLLSETGHGSALYLRLRQIEKSPKHLAEMIDGVNAAARKQPLQYLKNMRRFNDAHYTDYIEQYRPETYEISYYLYDSAKHPKPERLISDFSNVEKSSGEPPTLSADNPAMPLNATMRQSVLDGLTMIEAQLPGRFRFVEVTDPKHADFQFAAVAALPGAAAVTTGHSILFAAKSYEDAPRPTSEMQACTIHEIGHALGLKHPHRSPSKQRSGKKRDIENATLDQTVMAYDDNNAQAKIPLETWRVGMPVGFMPADLNVLLVKYPIRSDVEGEAPRLGSIANANEKSYVRVTLTGNDGTPKTIHFPKQGIGFEPIADTAHDHVTITSNLPEGVALQNEFKINQDTNSGGFATMAIKQGKNGLIISQPYNEGSAFVPVHAESVSLSPAVRQVVTMTGESELHVPTFTKADDGFASVNIQGKANRIVLDAANLKRLGYSKLNVQPGGQVHLHLEHIDQFIGSKEPIALAHLLEIDFSEGRKFGDPKLSGAVKGSLKHEANGGYTLRFTPTDAPFAPMEVTIDHDSTNPAADKLLAKALQTPIIAFDSFASRTAVPLVDEAPPPAPAQRKAKPKGKTR